MLPSHENSGTALEAGHTFDIPEASMTGEPTSSTAEESEGMSEFERRIAATSLMLRHVGSWSAKTYRLARRQLGIIGGVVLIWCRLNGSRLAALVQSWLRELVAWGRVAGPRYASQCRAQAVRLAQVTGPALQQGVTVSTRMLGRGAKAGWRGVSATGRGSYRLARRCIARRRHARARYPRAASRSTASRQSSVAGPATINRSPQRFNLLSAARDAWESEQEQGQQARAAFREAREAYEGAILRQLMERRLGVQVFPRFPEVTVDGLRFALRWHAQAEAYELTLLTACPVCGSTVASGDILHLADLGSVLDDLANGRNRCSSCRSVPRRFSVATEVEEPDRVIEGPGFDFNQFPQPADGAVHHDRVSASNGAANQTMPMTQVTPSEED